MSMALGASTGGDLVSLAIIVAAADNGVIGRNNAMPWHIPDDMRYFRRVTMGKPVIMGRKTYESIGKPLPGRSNIVISRDPDFAADGVQVALSLQEAHGLASEIARTDGVDEAVVMGGAQIYELAMPLAQTLYFTEVHANVEGDAVLAPIDWRSWREVSREPQPGEGAGTHDCSFVRYERIERSV